MDFIPPVDSTFRESFILDTSSNIEQNSDADSVYPVTTSGSLPRKGCHGLCVFGKPTDGNDLDMYYCTIGCKSKSGDYAVCAQCLEDGRHSGHAKYMVKR